MMVTTMLFMTREAGTSDFGRSQGDDSGSQCLPGFNVFVCVEGVVGGEGFFDGYEGQMMLSLQGRLFVKRLYGCRH